MTFYGNIEELTIKNNNYRKVISTNHDLQLVLMSLEPGIKIDAEIHGNIDQYIKVESGMGEAILGPSNNETSYDLKKDIAIIIPQGTQHTIKNTGQEPLKLYTVYSKRNHQIGKLEPQKTDEKPDKEETVIRGGGFKIYKFINKI